MNITRNSVSIGKRAYERTVWILVGLGCLGLWSGIYLDAQLAGTITYLVAAWAAMGLAFGLPRVTETKLSDERDEAHHNRASGLMFSIAAIATVSVVPALYVLDAGGYFTITSTMWGGIYVLSALALLYGLCYGIVLWRN
ncbi:DUF2178 domain-containing protein [Natronococcus roseus]|uniref:DUF2178 domain-containing protein n=1 Tax=Natronococcus roseus TaxID=1052014 RepID=UPI00374CD141